MELSTIGVTLLELIWLVVGGFLVGKTAHLLIQAVVKKIAKRTEIKLDDFVLEELDGPIVAISVSLVIYELSRHMENLSGLRDIIAKYSISITVFLLAYSAAEVVGAILRWYYVEGREKSYVKNLKVDVSLLPFVRKITKVIIVSVGTVFALSFVGINVTGLFAIASVVGVVLGLASQETLANIFAGLALQLDRPFSYGEYLKFSSNGEVARLVKIGLRSSRLEDLNGNVIMISNSELAKQRVTNLSRHTDEFGSSIQAELPKETDLKALEKHLNRAILSKEAKDFAGIKREKVSLVLEKVSANSVTISISFGVFAHPHLANARDFLNRKTLEFVLRKKK